ncbi:MAG: hypothetical protein HY900_25980 [Deltaproteobacteria bacterium]|nr:hypothetical protein [Deltaproteobacteria bacterium]
MKRDFVLDLFAAVTATLLVSAWSVGAVEASAATPIGTVIAGRPLAVAGESTKKPAIEDGSVNVLVFFHPEKEYSRLGLADLVPCVARTAGKPVRWATVVSASLPAEASLAAVRAAGLSLPVLLDEGDAYYAELGLSQLPAVVIFDKGRKLAVLQTFTKLNFCDHVFTQVRRTLGEISEAEARADLDPTPIPIRGEASAAMRHVKKAQLLLRNGDTEKALVAAREGVAMDDKLAAAHGTVGSCLAAAGNCAAAKEAFDKALALDPADARALGGKKACEALEK